MKAEVKAALTVTGDGYLLRVLTSVFDPGAAGL